MVRMPPGRLPAWQTGRRGAASRTHYYRLLWDLGP